jgi:hypothetical protein
MRHESVRAHRAARRGNAVAALPYFGAALLRVVKDHPKSVPLSTAHTANPVPEIDTIDPARSLHGPVADRKDNRITLLERYDFRPGLHSRPLLGHHELPAAEICAGL